VFMLEITGKVTVLIKLEVMPENTFSRRAVTAVLGTSHTTRKVRRCELWGLGGGGHR
jgi:hypothetical protein